MDGGDLKPPQAPSPSKKHSSQLGETQWPKPQECLNSSGGVPDVFPAGPLCHGGSVEPMISVADCQAGRWPEPRAHREGA
ncbi:hypothetical protein VULLAG_LOCUS10931 [Vulpes lagopus]